MFSLIMCRGGSFLSRTLRYFGLGCFTLLVMSSSLCLADGHDVGLRGLLADAGVGPLSAGDSADPALVDLGRSLFFDRELSGNRDTACASCHHPSLASGDSRSLPSGTGGEGLGTFRTQGEGREIVPRNSPEIFNRGNPEWTSMFWDSRVAKENGHFNSPAGPDLPPDLDNVLAVQAMFPVTSNAEMRGSKGDLDIYGQVNELANLDGSNVVGIWQAITDRLMAIPEYRQAFGQAFPDVPTDQLGFQHAANAIGAFEAAAFEARDSAWDRYLAGDDSAITESAKRGASHFYGGSCVSCHSGSLMTDQEHHNLGVPQLGPGKDPVTGLDPGRALVTGNEADEFEFRTPPLRNVAVTGPWMHNGAFTKLEDVIRHLFDPATSLENYDVSQLDELLQSTVRLEPEVIAALTSSLDPSLPIGVAITDPEVDDLMAFLFSLTSPSIDEILHRTPTSVHSGLEVDRLPSGDVSVTYDPEDGRLKLTGGDQIELDALFLRISDDEGTPAGFDFRPGSAVWSDDREIVLSDEVDAQSFIDFRSAPLLLLESGDTLGELLPAGLSEDSVVSHLRAAYRVHGSPELWVADVMMVPEPGAILLLVLGMSTIAARRCVGKTKSLSSRRRRLWAG